jgi:hypothetical protein
LAPDNPIYIHKRGEIKEFLHDYIGALTDYHKAHQLCSTNKKFEELSSQYWNDCDDLHHLIAKQNKENKV